MTAAARQRRRRKRMAAGRRVIRVEVDEAAVEDALIHLGYLEPLRADDQKEVSRALPALIDRACAVTRDDGGV